MESPGRPSTNRNIPSGRTLRVIADRRRSTSFLDSEAKSAVFRKMSVLVGPLFIVIFRLLSALLIDFRGVLVAKPGSGLRTPWSRITGVSALVVTHVDFGWERSACA